ncbi:28968_t:CDS:2 [Gigaspora margarita]|uniref:28968_t:CDS:1 n=1 Tax=Gigaspora margarita TaxID=4874 RepID=A0ABM8VXX4_GIGMA|nr:28968_t:CDS:2 [Gigaspora margarita]
MENQNIDDEPNIGIGKKQIKNDFYVSVVREFMGTDQINDSYFYEKKINGLGNI